MRVVLFGAGASFGCGDVSPRVPSLGNELFSALRRLYKSWRGIPDKLGARFEESFELGMQEIGGGKVYLVEEPAYAGANGSLKLAREMPAKHWEKLKG